MAAGKKTTKKPAGLEKRGAGRGILSHTIVHRWFATWRRLAAGYLARRPHRSFRRTRRRDYNRSLKLPGYWKFTVEVWRLLWRNRKIFLPLAFVYALLTALLIGIASQATYADYSKSLQESGGQILDGHWWQIGQAGILLASGALGSLSDTPTDVERLVSVLLGLMVWLATVWLLRAILAGKKPRMRDGLYNSGAPIISTVLVFLVLLIQLLPIALAVLAFTAASVSGLIGGGIEAMVFWIFEILLLLLSLYWLTGTMFGLVVVTLPGMYPLQALRTGGDLVTSRRGRLLLRFVWLLFVTFIVWVVTMIPLILLDGWIKQVWPMISWLPLVPIALLVISSLSIVWLSAYTYILYRKVVDDDAAPA